MNSETFRALSKLLRQVKTGAITEQQFIDEVERIVDESDAFIGNKTNISGNVTGTVISGNVKGPVNLQ